MKKWIAALLAMLLVVGLLAGCSSDKDTNDDDDKKSSQTDKDSDKDSDKDTDEDTDKDTGEKEESNGVAIGTILDEPEVVFDDEDMENFYYKAKLEAGGEEMDLEIAIKTVSADAYTYYMSMDSDGQYMAVVIEIDEDGNWATYERIDAKDDFVETTDSYTEGDVEDTLYEMMDIITTCVEVDWSEKDAELKKVKSANSKVYTYEVLIDGEESGTVSVNKKDGMIMEMEDTIDGIKVTVEDYSLTKHNIPSYK